MKMDQEVAETVLVSTKLLQQIWNKFVIQFVQTPGIDFAQFAFALPQFQNIRRIFSNSQRRYAFASKN